jgi:hypothetical protein
LEINTKQKSKQINKMKFIKKITKNEFLINCFYFSSFLQNLIFQWFFIYIYIKLINSTNKIADEGAKGIGQVLQGLT